VQCVAGAGESGKSTFLKQMKIIHGAGFCEDERRKFICVVHHNLCVAMQTLVRAMEKLQIRYEDISNVVSSLNLIFITGSAKFHECGAFF
jgi:hypothetical protein